jgi:alpha-maltose-1-phosphate synthase
VNRTQLNILLLSLEFDATNSGGVGTYVAELSAGLARQGNRVNVISYSNEKHAVLHSENRSVHLIKPSAVRRSDGPASITDSILRFNDDIVAYARWQQLGAGVDLIHCNNWLTFPAARELADRWGIPIVCTIHYVSNPVERWWGQEPDPLILEQEKILFRSAPHFIAVSKSVGQVAAAAYQIAEEDIDVVHNGVSDFSFCQTQITSEKRVRLKEAAACAAGKLVLFAGRIHPQKGVEALLQSAKLVLRQDKCVTYLIAGEADSSEYSREIRALIASDPSLGTSVTFLGRVPRNQLSLLYKCADVTVIPSIYDPFPYVGLEASLAGAAIVGTRSGGLEEMIRDGVTGLLVNILGGQHSVKTVDVEQLSAATQMLLADGQTARRLGCAAREYVLRNFTFDSMVEKTNRVYLDVVEQKARCYS